jgi:hypothetical protein
MAGGFPVSRRGGGPCSACCYFFMYAVTAHQLHTVVCMRRLGILSLGVVAPVLRAATSSCMRSQPTSCIPWPSCAVRASSPLGWWPLFCVLLLLHVCGHSPPAAYRGLHAPFGHPLPWGGVPCSATANWIPKAMARTRPPDPGRRAGTGGRTQGQDPGATRKIIDCRFPMSLRGAMAVGTPCTRGAPSRKPRALYTRHEVLAYKPTTAQYPV